MIYFLAENCGAVAPIALPVSLRTVNSFSFFIVFYFLCGRNRIRTYTAAASTLCSTIGAIRPFVWHEYWLITISSSSNSSIIKQSFIESCRRFELLSFDLQSNAYAMSATRTFCGWKRLELSTIGLISRLRRDCHWAIHPCWPGETRTHNPPVKSRILPPLSYEPLLWWLIGSNYQPLRYQRNALNHWAKSSLLRFPDLNWNHLPYESSMLPLHQTAFCRPEQVRTVNLERIRFLL